MSAAGTSRALHPSAEELADEGNVTNVGVNLLPDAGKLSLKSKQPAVNIEFHDLVYAVNTAAGKKNLLDSISGCFESGKLSAVMGPSGAGKTTLMDVLMGLVTSHVQGTILINGHVHKLQILNALSGYIMQEDLLRPHLSVEESMMICADLKLGNKISKSEKIQKINEIIDSMGLQSCRSVYTNCLSGGQLKRTSIALELISNPSVLFLDEPTSGLDTVAAAKCLELLKRLAREGRTVVCNLHQLCSSAFYLLDHVFFMANGRCIYQGEPRQLVPFLEQAGFMCKSTYNPADFILEILNNKTGVKLSKEINNGKTILNCSSQRLLVLRNRPPIEKDDAVSKQDTQFPISPLVQFFILYRRRVTIQKRDTTTLWILFMHHIITALAIGVTFQGVGNDGSRPFENVKLCISVALFHTYTFSMIPTITFPDEMKYLKREYLNRWYGLNAYYMTIILASLPIMLVFGSIFQAIVYVLTDQPLEWYRFVNFSVAALMSGSIAEGYGTLVGSLMQCTSAAVLTPLLFATQLTVCFYGFGSGQLIEPSMHALMSLSYLRCVLVIISLAIYDQRANLYCPVDQWMCLYKEPHLILRDLGISNYSLTNQFILLIFFYVSIRVAVYYSLRFQLDKDLSMKVVSFSNTLLNRTQAKRLK